jgi:hypothetical protein
MKSGMTPELKKIASYFMAGVSLYASYITIRTDKNNSETEASLRAKAESALGTALETAKRAEHQVSANNFVNKLHLNSIKNSFTRVITIREEKSELVKAIEALDVE